MKTSIYGLAGIVAACLIFTTVVASSSNLARLFSTNVSPEIPTFPIGENATVAMSLTVSNFTEPPGVESEANVTFGVISGKSIPNVTLHIEISPIYVGQGEWPNVTWVPIGPRGIELVDGNPSQVVDLSANRSASITLRVRATKVGYAVIIATATWLEGPSTIRKNECALQIRVLENNVDIYDGTQIVLFP